MSVTTQCRKPLASGSTTLISHVEIFVPGGTLHESGGMMPAPSQVYLAGMTPSVRNASLVTVIAACWGPVGFVVFVVAFLALLHPANTMMGTANSTRKARRMAV